MDNETNMVHVPSDATSFDEATTIGQQQNTETEAVESAVVENTEVVAYAEVAEAESAVTEEPVAEGVAEGNEAETTETAEPTEAEAGSEAETETESSESAAEGESEATAETETTATEAEPAGDAPEAKTEEVREPISKIKAHFIGYAAGVGVLLILVLIRLIVMDNHVNKLEAELQEAVEAKKTAEMDLEREKTALEEKITLLSDKVAVQIVADEEAEAKKVPSGLPVTGRVSIVAEPVFVDEDGDGEPDGELTAFDDNGDHTWSKPIESDDGEEIIITQENITALPIVFGASAGSKVVASGAGKVLTIESDETYGNAVVIDHENGYMTIYTYLEEPKVNVGDEVLKGQLIFDITSDNSEVEFQVFLNDEPIDPMEIIMISG